jgi:hypothetical protein
MTTLTTRLAYRRDAMHYAGANGRSMNQDLSEAITAIESLRQALVFAQAKFEMIAKGQMAATAGGRMGAVECQNALALTK